MNDSYEAYVLCTNRSCALGTKFLDTFAPSRQAAADEFPFPEFADSHVAVLKTPEDVMRRLETERADGYALYWTCDADRQFSHAMLIFTKDGGMIAGLVAVAGGPADVLLEIASTVSGRFGYITTEGRPPETSEEFISICKLSTVPALVDGVICNREVKLD